MDSSTKIRHIVQRIMEMCQRIRKDINHGGSFAKEIKYILYLLYELARCKKQFHADTDNGIAYVLAGKLGIDTAGMAPRQVWDAIEEKGLSLETVYNELDDSDGNLQTMLHKAELKKEIEEQKKRLQEKRKRDRIEHPRVGRNERCGDVVKYDRKNRVDGKTTYFDHDEEKLAVSEDFSIVDKVTGQKYLMEKQTLKHVTVFAGDGCGRALDVANRLADKHGGKPEEWMHVKAIGFLVDGNGKKEKFDIHWFEHPKHGQHDWKPKFTYASMEENTKNGNIKGAFYWK